MTIVTDQEILEVAETRRTGYPIYQVDGKPATLDELIEAYLAFQDLLVQYPETYTQAVEMQHIRNRARANGSRPPAPLAWLPIIAKMQEEVL